VSSYSSSHLPRTCSAEPLALSKATCKKFFIKDPRLSPSEPISWGESAYKEKDAALVKARRLCHRL